ncbi:MAG: YggT family protein [Chloroflexi bacterium]|nr:YggT family protein [Chloroflexota bacterium]
METLFQIIQVVVIFLQVCIIVRSLMSFFPASSPGNPLAAFLFTVTEPILAPLRRIIPRLGMIDITPLIAILLLFLLQELLRAAVDG